jgi:hypothetical protein
MKNYTFTSVIHGLCFAQQQTVSSSISPNPFEETTSITITISGSTVDEAAWELRIILYIYGLGMIPMI